MLVLEGSIRDGNATTQKISGKGLPQASWGEKIVDFDCSGSNMNEDRLIVLTNRGRVLCLSPDDNTWKQIPGLLDTVEYSQVSCGYVYILNSFVT